MPRRATHQRTERNRLLRALPAAEYERFLPLLTVVSFQTGEVVLEARARITYVYFPRTAVFSMVSIMRDGAAEAGTAGDEGISGLPAFLGVDSTTTQSLVQIAGDAGRIGVRAFAPRWPRTTPCTCCCAAIRTRS